MTATAWALVVAAAVVAGGCSSTAGGPPPARNTQVAPSDVRELVLPCARGGGSEPAVPDDYEEIAGVVALPTAASAPAALQVSEQGDGGAGRRFWAKTGLLVRARAHAEIAPAAAGAVAMGWGNPARPHDRVVVEACDEPAGWVAWPGGFWVDEPRCVHLVVTSGGRSHDVQVGVGAACPGQDPPPAPVAGR